MEPKEIMENETVGVVVDNVEKITDGCNSTKVAAIASLGAITIIGGSVILYKKVIKPKVLTLKKKIATEMENRKDDKKADHVEKNKIHSISE